MRRWPVNGYLILARVPAGQGALAVSALLAVDMKLGGGLMGSQGELARTMQVDELCQDRTVSLCYKYPLGVLRKVDLLSPV